MFSSQQSKAKDFRKYCCSVLFPHVRQQLANKMEEDHQRTITRMQEDHQLAIEEHEQAVVLYRIQAIQCENVALQAQRDVYQTQLQRCEDIITHLREHYVDQERDPGEDNIIIIVQKHSTPANYKYHNLSYYIARIQLRKRYLKLR